MAGTHSSADESQSLSIDTGRLWWLDDVNGKTIFFLKNRGITELRTQAVCGVGLGVGGQRTTCPRATRGRWLSRHIQSSRQSEEPKWATSKLLDPEKHLKNSKLPSGPSGQLYALVALTSSGC